MSRRKIQPGDLVYVTMVAEWDDHSASDKHLGFVRATDAGGVGVSIGIPQGAAAAPVNPQVALGPNFLQEDRIRADAARRLERAEDVGDAGERRPPSLGEFDGQITVALKEGNVLFADGRRYQVVDGRLVESDENAVAPFRSPDVDAFKENLEKTAGNHQEKVLEEAQRLICGPRRDDYGPVREGFNWVAEFWTTYLRAKGLTAALSAEDVCFLMILLKTARGMENTRKDKPVKRDTVVDVAGYAGLIGELNEDGAQQ